MVAVEEIPPELVFNWDQTCLNLVPSSSWMMEERGAKCVELDDIRQITAVFCGTLSRDFQYIQVIYISGQDVKMPPSPYQFPHDWHITHSPKHWSTEENMKEYLHEIIFPYTEGVRAKNGLKDVHPALAIFDNFMGQVTDSITQFLEEHTMHIVKLLANCTDRLQLMDISINKAAKDFLWRKFNEWYSEQVAAQLGDGDIDRLQAELVKLTTAAMKPVGAKWLVHEYIQETPS